MADNYIFGRSALTTLVCALFATATSTAAPTCAALGCSVHKEADRACQVRSCFCFAVLRFNVSSPCAPCLCAVQLPLHKVQRLLLGFYDCLLQLHRPVPWQVQASSARWS